MAKPRSYYTREFKIAILPQIEAGVPMAQVARENGIHPTLVARWKKEYLVNPENAFAGPGHPYKNQAGVAELERMVGKLYAENEFLKELSQVLYTNRFIVLLDDRRKKMFRRRDLSERGQKVEGHHSRTH